MEKFSVEVNAVDGGVLVALTGEIDLVAADGLYDELERAAASSDVVLDCAGITFIDSAGLRTFIKAARKAEASGTRLRLAAVPAPVARVFALAGVLELFTIGEDPAQALTDAD